MRDHLKILGWLYVANGGLVLLVAAVLGTMLGAAGVASASAMFGILAIAVGFGIAIFGLPSLICGWGLLNYRPWARVLGIILSALNLANFPVGTLIGGYGLWVLLNDESRRMLEAGDPRYPQLGRGW
jgi:hypothetical protein